MIEKILETENRHPFAIGDHGILYYCKRDSSLPESKSKFEDILDPKPHYQVFALDLKTEKSSLLVKELVPLPNNMFVIDQKLILSGQDQRIIDLETNETQVYDTSARGDCSYGIIDNNLYFVSFRKDLPDQVCMLNIAKGELTAPLYELDDYITDTIRHFGCSESHIAFSMEFQRSVIFISKKDPHNLQELKIDDRIKKIFSFENQIFIATSDYFTIVNSDLKVRRIPLKDNIQSWCVAGQDLFLMTGGRTTIKESEEIRESAKVLRLREDQFETVFASQATGDTSAFMGVENNLCDLTGNTDGIFFTEKRGNGPWVTKRLSLKDMNVVDEAEPIRVQIEDPDTTESKDYDFKMKTYSHLFGEVPHNVCPIPQLALTCPGLCIIPFNNTKLSCPFISVSFGLAGKAAGSGISLENMVTEQEGNTTRTSSEIVKGPQISKDTKLAGYGFELVAGYLEESTAPIAAIQWFIHAHLVQNLDVMEAIYTKGGMILGPYGIGEERQAYYLVTNPWGDMPKGIDLGEKQFYFFNVLNVTTSEVQYAKENGIQGLTYELIGSGMPPYINYNRETIL
jgi:hypothetical protein